MSGCTLVMYMRKGNMVSSTRVLTTLFLGNTCSLIVPYWLSSASRPPRLFIQLSVVPCTLARAERAALM